MYVWLVRLIGWCAKIFGYIRVCAHVSYVVWVYCGDVPFAILFTFEMGAFSACDSTSN